MPKMYLIVKCDELCDQFECDADRMPVCLTEDASQYGLGFEVYQVNIDNSLTLIKDYETGTGDSGMALYYWDEEEDDSETPPTVIKKWVGLNSNSVSKSLIKRIREQAKFDNSLREIIEDIRHCGSHGEEIDGKWVVFGDYIDSWYPSGC